MYPKTQIIRFDCIDSRCATFYNCTVGSVCSGSSDLRAFVKHPPEDITDRIRVADPYWRRVAVQILLTNKAWQYSIGRFAVLVKNIGRVFRRMLGCKPSGVQLAAGPLYPCHQYWVCPYCLHRKMLQFYDYLKAALYPQAVIWCGSITVSSNLSAIPTAADVQHLNNLIHTMDRKRYWKWTHAVMLPMPKFVEATPDAGPHWQVSANFVMLVPAGAQFSDRVDNKKWVPKNALDCVFTSNFRRVGPATPDVLATTIGNVFRYPAQLLYATLDPEQLARLYSAFKNNKKGLICRARQYGPRQGA